MGQAKQRGAFSERVREAKERKELVEEQKRLERMQREKEVSPAQKRKRHKARMLFTIANSLEDTWED